MAKTVLLIEDEAILQRMYQEVLEREGFDVLTAGDGAEGFELLTGEQTPDLVVCDIMMPNTSGLEFLDMKHSHKDKNIRAVPVIMLTNLKDDEIIEKTKQLGAIDYFLKFEDEHGDLVKKVKETLLTSDDSAQSS